MWKQKLLKNKFQYKWKENYLNIEDILYKVKINFLIFFMKKNSIKECIVLMLDIDINCFIVLFLRLKNLLILNLDIWNFMLLERNLIFFLRRINKQDISLMMLWVRFGVLVDCRRLKSEVINRLKNGQLLLNGLMVRKEEKEFIEL